jgi:hypothetical protein
MKRLLLSLLAACSAVSTAPADDPPDLLQARSEYAQRLAPLRTKLDDAVNARTAKYVTDLKAVEDRTAASGQLDAVLVVKAEREIYEKGGSTMGFDPKNPVVPQAARQARVAFDGDLQRLRAAAVPEAQKLAANYVERLAALERKLTTQKDIAGALSVRQERESVQKAGMNPLSPITVVGQWSYSHRGKKENRTYTFRGDGTWENSIRDFGTWKWTDQAKREVTWNYKNPGATRIDNCVLSADGKQLVGHDNSNAPIVLERLR